MKTPRKAKKKNLKQMAFTRFMLVVAVLVLWIGGISVRLVHLQVTQHAWLKEKALDMRQDVKSTRMLRGSIYDRNERALAMSVRARTLYADPTEIADPEATAKVIAKTLTLDARQIASQIRKGKEAKKRYMVLAKKVDEDVFEKINKALDTPDVKKSDLPYFTGLHWRDDQKRSYPYQTLAAQVVGFSNADDDGKAGIEQSQDDVLHGAVIKKLQERDRLGRVYDETFVERETPSDVVLTLDTGFQYMTEQALERGVRAANAKSGMAIVMNPKTGEILALANYPTFDPNTINDAEAENIGNKAIQAVYSPGSVFKIVTYGSALEKHLFAPEDEIDSGNGMIEIGDRKFQDAHAVGRVSYLQAMAASSNVCAIKIAMKVGREDFFTTTKKLGFGAKTGVELPAETQGILRSPKDWKGDSLASMSIGYEIGVTALQMATAFATIANDGIRVQPRIIKEIRPGNEQPKVVPQVQQTEVFTGDTSRNLKAMLRQVVLTGTGRRAQLNGYTSAGKTGTAWKFDSKTKTIDSNKYVSSFIGMAPAGNPEIVVAVVLDEPKVAARDGGTVAAPVFREIAQNILQEMKVASDAPEKQDAVVAKVVPESTSKSAEIKSLPAESKPESGAKAKPAESPAVKPKPKDIKKTNDKKFGDTGKLTAFLFRRFNSHDLSLILNTKLET